MWAEHGVVVGGGGVEVLHLLVRPWLKLVGVVVVVILVAVVSAELH